LYSEKGRVQPRRIWSLKPPIKEKHIAKHLHYAIRSTAVLDVLYAGLRDDEIEFEVD